MPYLTTGPGKKGRGDPGLKLLTLREKTLLSSFKQFLSVFVTPLKSLTQPGDTRVIVLHARAAGGQVWVPC